MCGSTIFAMCALLRAQQAMSAAGRWLLLVVNRKGGPSMAVDVTIGELLQQMTGTSTVSRVDNIDDRDAQAACAGGAAVPLNQCWACTPADPVEGYAGPLHTELCAGRCTARSAHAVRCPPPLAAQQHAVLWLPAQSSRHCCLQCHRRLTWKSADKLVMRYLSTRWIVCSLPTMMQERMNNNHVTLLLQCWCYWC